MNTWNTLPESYKQRVYKNTLVSVKRQIQQVENPMPAEVISVEAAHVDKAILLDHLASEVVLEEREIRSTDPNIPMDNDCTDDKLHFGIPVGGGDYEDEGDESDKRDAIPIASSRPRPATYLETFDLGTSDVEGYDGYNVDDADADEEDDASLANEGSIQNVEN